jgi:hypothetical protein
MQIRRARAKKRGRKIKRKQMQRRGNKIPITFNPFSKSTPYLLRNRHSFLLWHSGRNPQVIVIISTALTRMTISKEIEVDYALII